MPRTEEEIREAKRLSVQKCRDKQRFKKQQEQQERENQLNQELQEAKRIVASKEAEEEAREAKVREKEREKKRRQRAKKKMSSVNSSTDNNAESIGTIANRTDSGAISNDSPAPHGPNAVVDGNLDAWTLMQWRVRNLDGRRTRQGANADIVQEHNVSIMRADKADQDMTRRLDDDLRQMLVSMGTLPSSEQPLEDEMSTSTGHHRPEPVMTFPSTTPSVAAQRSEPPESIDKPPPQETFDYSPPASATRQPLETVAPPAGLQTTGLPGKVVSSMPTAFAPVPAAGTAPDFFARSSSKPTAFAPAARTSPSFSSGLTMPDSFAPVPAAGTAPDFSFGAMNKPSSGAFAALSSIPIGPTPGTIPNFAKSEPTVAASSGPLFENTNASLYTQSQRFSFGNPPAPAPASGRSVAFGGFSGTSKSPGSMRQGSLAFGSNDSSNAAAAVGNGFLKNAVSLTTNPRTPLGSIKFNQTIFSPGDGTSLFPPDELTGASVSGFSSSFNSGGAPAAPMAALGTASGFGTASAPASEGRSRPRTEDTMVISKKKQRTVGQFGASSSIAVPAAASAPVRRDALTEQTAKISNTFRGRSHEAHENG
jgi:hypothetical protein